MTVFTHVAAQDFAASLMNIELVGAQLSEPAALMPSQLTVTNAMCCASVVLLSGYFEDFLKSIIREFIENINALSLPKNMIPAELISAHYAGGSDALAWAVKVDKNSGTSSRAEDLSRRLGSFGASGACILAWESFANTKSNPGASVVATLLRGLMIPGGWTEINALTSAHGRLDTFLTSFMEMRNICAHTGRHSTPPTGLDIQEYAATFRAICECLDMLLAIRFEEFAVS